jgi:CheY-like chemotaxis protein
MADSKSVYVIDDDEIFHFIIKKLFKQCGNDQNNLTITSFFSAEDALEQLRTPGQPLPSLIIVDINMQPMNGWEFIKAFRELQPALARHISLIMCSSSVDERDIQQVNNTPELAAYITKPLDKAKLEIIEKHL